MNNLPEELQGFYDLVPIVKKRWPTGAHETLAALALNQADGTPDAPTLYRLNGIVKGDGPNREFYVGEGSFGRVNLLMNERPQDGLNPARSYSGELVGIKLKYEGGRELLLPVDASQGQHMTEFFPSLARLGEAVRPSIERKPVTRETRSATGNDVYKAG